MAVQDAPIYEDLLRRQRFPEALFKAPHETNKLLRQALKAGKGGK